MIDYRLAVPTDHPAILKIAQENMRENLPPEERAEGFLTGRYSAEILAAIAADLGIIVVYDADDLAGFLCATGIEFGSHSPATREMLTNFTEVKFEGCVLADYKTCMYGPVCIASPHRGRGFLKGLFNAFCQHVAPDFEVGVGFVDEDNQYSLDLHLNGLDMTDVGQFTFEKRRYHILACDVRAGD